MIELPGGKILGPYESREDWLEARKLGLGGSDIGAILGMSTYTSPLEVFYSKTDDAVEREVNEAMEIGRDIESWILDRWDRSIKYTHVTNSDLIVIQSNEYPFLLHSPDAIHTWEDGTPIAGVEIKNIRSDQHWDPLPDFYMAQVQHGLLCSGLDRWIVVALVGGQKLITREIEPDKELQGRITLAAGKFWTSHVLANVPPEPDGSESASNVLNRRWEASQDESVELPGDMALQLQTVEQDVKTAEGRRALLHQRIKTLMGDKEYAVVSGKKVATWKVSTRTSVDVTRLRTEDPEIAKKYEKTSPTRIFRPNL